MPFNSQTDLENYLDFIQALQSVPEHSLHCRKPPVTSRASLTTQQDSIKTVLVIAGHKFQLLSLTEEELAGKAEINSKQVCNEFAFIAEKNNSQVLRHQMTHPLSF